MLSLAKNIKKKIELNENLVGTGFLEPPQALRKAAKNILKQHEEEMSHRVTVIGEIMSTSGFTERSLYIMYQLLLPEQDWVYEDNSEYEMYGIVRDDLCEFNKRSSVTQIQHGKIQKVVDPNIDEVTKYQCHFSFPFEHQFLAKDNYKFESVRPHLLMQVNSVDSWNRHRIEGYGFVRLPQRSGYHEISINTWRPRASLNSEIHSYFLGGSVRIQKMEELVRTQYIGINGESDLVNRFGLETEDAGRINVNINICTQDIGTRKLFRHINTINKEKEKLETRKLVMKYSLDLKKRQESKNKQKILNEDYNDDEDLQNYNRKNNENRNENDSPHKFANMMPGAGSRF